jgi:hypothetical protein
MVAAVKREVQELDRNQPIYRAIALYVKAGIDFT